jgi:hypothetical protein
VWLNDTLVAPIWDSSTNESTRDVWVPPGEWVDGWSGAKISGPKNVTVTQPFARIPLWHRVGGLVVAAPEPGSRVDAQDWSTLVLEAFPSATAATTTNRAVVERGADTGGARTDLALTTDGRGAATISIGSVGRSSLARAWVLRVHLAAGETVQTLHIDGVAVHGPTAVTAAAAPLTAIPPVAELGDVAGTVFPFQGVGAADPPAAGDVVEIPLARASHARTVRIQIIAKREPAV